MFADNLVELRKYHAMSQEELAERIGVSRQTLSKYETGESLPDIEKCKALADVFGVTVDPHDNQYQLLWMALNHLLCQMTHRHLTPWILAHSFALVKRFFKNLGDPYRIRTDVKGVRGLCLNHLTNGPWCTFRDSNPGPTD